MGGSLRSPSGAYGAAVPGSRFPVLARRYAPRGSRFPVPRSLLGATRRAVPGSTFCPRLRRGLLLRSRFAPMHFELSGDTNPEPGTSNREPCREPRTAAPQARQNREPGTASEASKNGEPGTGNREPAGARSAPAGEQRAERAGGRAASGSEQHLSVAVSQKDTSDTCCQWCCVGLHARARSCGNAATVSNGDVFARRGRQSPEGRTLCVKYSRRRFSR